MNLNFRLGNTPLYFSDKIDIDTGDNIVKKPEKLRCVGQDSSSAAPPHAHLSQRNQQRVGIFKTVEVKLPANKLFIV